MPHFHVSSVLNRASITEFGLDWARMSAAPGIAGSSEPEVEGAFLCAAEWEADWFIRMNNTQGPVDLWQVDGVPQNDLVDNGSGYFYYPGRIAPARLTLLRRDVPSDPDV